MLKLDGYGWKWKIPVPLAFSKLVLKVKVKFLLISWHFLVAFSLRPPNPPIHWNSHFCHIKYIQLVHIWAKFHLCLTCISPVLKFQMFSVEGTILGCFWAFFFGRNPLKCGQICLKFWPVMQCNIMHQEYDGFYFILKKRLKLSQKKFFSGSFWEVFGLRLLKSCEFHPNLQANVTSYWGTYLW